MSRSFTDAADAIAYLRMTTAWPIKDHTAFIVDVESPTDELHRIAGEALDKWTPNKFWRAKRVSRRCRDDLWIHQTTVMPTDPHESATGLLTVASAFKYYPFKGVAKFYDVGGLLNDPKAFAMTVNEMARIAKERFPTANKIGLLDARGFLFTPVALKLKLPIAMVRKPGKMPNTVTSGAYDTEYGHRDGVGVQRHAVGPKDRVLLIDDLVATGGTLGAAVECVRAAGAEVAGCLTLVELEAFDEQRAKVIPDDVEHVGLFPSERALLSNGATAADVDLDYRDDGAQFESKGAMPKV